MLILRKNLTRPLTWDELDQNQELLQIDEWVLQSYKAKQNVIVISGDTTTIYHCLQCHSADVYAPENTFKRYYGATELWMPIGTTFNNYPSDTDIYVTGMTYSVAESGNTLTVLQTVGYPPVSVTIPNYSLYDHYTYQAYLTGTTLTLKRTGSLPNLTVDLQPIVNIATGVTHTDYYVTGATLNHSTYVLTLKRNDGVEVTVNLASLRDGNYYTTGATLSGNTVVFTKNFGSSYSVDLSPLITGTTGGGSIIIYQTGHSFNVMDVVRATTVEDVFTLAQADNEVNADMIGVVSRIIDANSFVLTIDGEISNASVPNKPIGTYMFLSPYIPGALIDYEPFTIGEISMPVGIVLEPAARFMVIHNRGSQIVEPFTGGTSGYSGYSGEGYSGSDGASGYSGYSGLGYSGSDGASGYSGYSGSGISGYSGYSGISGAMGLSYYSAGVVSLPSFTDNTGNSYTVGTGTYNFYTNTGSTGELVQYVVTGDTFSTTTGMTNYVVANYNGGSPEIQNITDVSLIKESTVLPVYTIFYSPVADAIDYLAWDTLANGLSNKLNRRLVKTERFSRESGFMLSEVATRKIAITGGNVWYGGVETSFSDFQSDAVGSTFREWVYYTSGWTPTVVTQYDNLSYQGANGKSDLDNNKYAVVWIYKKIASNSVLGNVAGYIFSTNEYNNATEALNSDIPTSLPPIFVSFGMLVGRIIIQQGQSAAEVVESAFEHAYVGGIPGNSGYSGYSGLSGYSGDNPGSSGYSGYSGSGAIGYSGYSGASGYSGYSGSGASGYSGYSGQGYSGYSGSGVSGYSGYSGQGYSGYSGYSGQSGYSGYSGISGYSGYSGKSGYSGYSGYSGMGYSGYSGYNVSGYSGYSGAVGSSGLITDPTFFMDTATDTVYAQNLTVGSGTSGVFQYRDGAQGAGKVLQSDANGNASWVSGSTLTINTNADSRILTANGTTASIDAESNLTFSDNTLNQTSNKATIYKIESYHTGSTSSGAVTTEGPTLFSIRGRGTTSNAAAVMNNDVLFDHKIFAMYGTGITTTKTNVVAMRVEARANYNVSEDGGFLSRYSILISPNITVVDSSDEAFAIDNNGIYNQKAEYHNNAVYNSILIFTGDTSVDSYFSYVADVPNSTAVNLSLPAASSSEGLTIYVVTNSIGAGGSLIVRRNGSDTIAWSASNLTISTAHKYIMLQSDGVSNWLPLSSSL